MIKNLIFDFDGVIVDSEILASRAFFNYLTNKGHKLTEEDLYRYAGMKTAKVIDVLSKKYKINDKKKFSNDILNLVSQVYSKIYNL